MSPLASAQVRGLRAMRRALGRCDLREEPRVILDGVRRGCSVEAPAPSNAAVRSFVHGVDGR